MSFLGEKIIKLDTQSCYFFRHGFHELSRIHILQSVLIREIRVEQIIKSIFCHIMWQIP